MKKVIKLLLVAMVSVAICPNGYAQWWGKAPKTPKLHTTRVLRPRPIPSVPPITNQQNSNSGKWKPVTPVVLPTIGGVQGYTGVASTAFTAVKVPPSLKIKVPVSPEQIYNDGCSLLEKGDTVSAMKSFKEAAEKGHTDAQEAYGAFLLNGWGVAKDELEGLKWLMVAADNNHLFAKLEVGDFFMSELQDTLTAATYYEDACECAQDSCIDNIDKYKASMSIVCNNLGVFYYNGFGVKKNVKKALIHWFHSAKWGNPEAIYDLGTFYEAGLEVRKDSLFAVKLYKWAAQMRHTESMIALTRLYYYAGDNDSTIIWGSRPECMDSVDAQYYVGNAYRGKGDYSNATLWLKRAASQNDASAYFDLACIYYNELKDSIAYLSSLQQAADLGWADAINDMGVKYLEGVFVEKNIGKAKEYFCQAAEKGSLLSYQNLGVIYYGKKYGMRDYKVAADYWRQGAELGSPRCQYDYSCVLRKGKGVKKDKKQADKWMILAARNGVEEAHKYLQKKHIDWNLPMEGELQSSQPQLVLKRMRVVDVDGIGVTVVEE